MAEAKANLHSFSGEILVRGVHNLLKQGKGIVGDQPVCIGSADEHKRSEKISAVPDGENFIIREDVAEIGVEIHALHAGDDFSDGGKQFVGLPDALDSLNVLEITKEEVPGNVLAVCIDGGIGLSEDRVCERALQILPKEVFVIGEQGVFQGCEGQVRSVGSIFYREFGALGPELVAERHHAYYCTRGYSRPGVHFHIFGEDLGIGGYHPAGDAAVLLLTLDGKVSFVAFQQGINIHIALVEVFSGFSQTGSVVAFAKKVLNLVVF